MTGFQKSLIRTLPLHTMHTLISSSEHCYLPLILQPTLDWETHTAPSEFFSSSLEKWLDQCLSKMEGTHTGC